MVHSRRLERVYYAQVAVAIARIGSVYATDLVPDVGSSRRVERGADNPSALVTRVGCCHQTVRESCLLTLASMTMVAHELVGSRVLLLILLHSSATGMPNCGAVRDPGQGAAAAYMGQSKPK